MSDLVTGLQLLTLQHVIRRALGAKGVHHRFPPAKLPALAEAVYKRLIDQGWTPPPVARPKPFDPRIIRQRVPDPP